MTLKKLPRFDNELEDIIDFITLDSPSRALVFYDELIKKINQIGDMPYAYKRRDSSKNDNLRELIFKGYTVPFYIDKQEEKIIILGIFNQNIWSIDESDTR